MSEEKWGVGNAKDAKSFTTVSIGKMSDEYRKSIELFHGEHPHSRRDNNVYARDGAGIEGFDGHGIPIRIDVEEYNYLKTSGLSGDEYRKGCSVKVYADGIQIFDDFARSYMRGFQKACNFVDELELYWDWFPKKVDTKIGAIIAYHDGFCRVTSFIVSQGCMMIETLDGKPFPKRAWEDDDDFEQDNTAKVEITSPHVYWWPNEEKVKEALESLKAKS